MNYSENMKETFRDRLKEIIHRKINTTMIFPLSQFETAFGELWGNGKPYESLSDEEVVNRTKWEQCRNNILNNGNRQKRRNCTGIVYVHSYLESL